MKRDEAVFLVQSRFGGMDEQQARIVAELQLAQVMCERKVKKIWFLEKVIDRDVGVDGYTMVPADFLEEYEPKSFWLTDVQNNTRALAKLTYDVAFPKYSTQSGIPKVYDLINDTIYVFPIPDRTYACKLRYYGRDVVLDQNIENGFLKYVPDLLINIACVGIAQYAEPSMMQSFAGIAQVAERAFEMENEMRRISNQDMKLGDDF